MDNHLPGEHGAYRRFPRRTREIVLAALLTVVAIGYIAVSLWRGDLTFQRPPNVETARKPSSN